MSNKYDWGIYNPLGGEYDFREKDKNLYRANQHMLNKTLRMFNYSGLPDSIDPIEMEKIIQTEGFVVVFEHNGQLEALKGGWGGEPDKYGRPTKIVVNNPALKLSKELTVGADCIVVSNDYVGMGLLPIFNKYNYLLMENEITMVRANINKRIDNIFSVSDDNTAESARIFLNQLEDGQLGYITENKLYEGFKTHNTTTTNGVKMMDLVEYQQYIKSNLYNEIGLESVSNMKKERMVVDEVNVDNASIYTLVDTMLESRVLGFDGVNELFGLDIEVTLGGSWGERYIEVEQVEEIIDSGDMKEVDELEEIVEVDNEQDGDNGSGEDDRE